MYKFFKLILLFLPLISLASCCPCGQGYNPTTEKDCAYLEYYQTPALPNSP